jgi:hypothetical protein
MTDPAPKPPHDDADDLFNVPAISPKRPGAMPPKRPGLENVERAITRAEKKRAQRKITSVPPPRPVKPVAQAIGDPTEPLPPDSELDERPSLRNVWIACGAIVAGALMAVAVPIFKRTSAPPEMAAVAPHDTAPPTEPKESDTPRDPQESNEPKPHVIDDPMHEAEPTPHVATIPAPQVEPPVETTQAPAPVKPPVDVAVAPPIHAPTPPRTVEPEPSPMAHTGPVVTEAHTDPVVTDHVGADHFAELPLHPAIEQVPQPPPQPPPEPVAQSAPPPAAVPTASAKPVRPVPVPAPALSGPERLQVVETALAAGRRAFARAELGRILLDLDALPANEREETRAQAELLVARTLQELADDARRTAR